MPFEDILELLLLFPFTILFLLSTFCWSVLFFLTIVFPSNNILAFPSEPSSCTTFFSPPEEDSWLPLSYPFSTGFSSLTLLYFLFLTGNPLSSNLYWDLNCAMWSFRHFIENLSKRIDALWISLFSWLYA